MAQDSAKPLTLCSWCFLGASMCVCCSCAVLMLVLTAVDIHM